MIILCENPCRVCTPFIGGASSPSDPDYPFVNVSSEDPDEDRFIGRRFGPTPGPPPLGGIFFAIGCVGFCVSTVSQEDADLCAARQEILCLGNEWPENPPFPQGPPPTLDPREVFSNTQQSCPFTCPDGQVFTFVVAEGLFSAFSQLEADIAAQSYACLQAVQQRLCIGTLSPTLACSDAEYNGEISVSSANLPVTFTTEGTLPPGIVLSQNVSTLFLTGTPTVPGNYSFTVIATDVRGSVMEKVVALTIFGISNESPLPEAEVGEPYSVTLNTAGTVTGNVTFEVTVGALPDGLTLNTTTGEISGTPTVEGPFSFTVRATSSSIACSKGFGIQVEDSDCPNWDNLLWGVPNLIESGGTASFFPVSAPLATFSGALSIDNVAASLVSAENFGTIDYNGPGCNCNLRYDRQWVAVIEASDVAQYQITSNLAGILAVGFFVTNGSDNVPFVIPDTLGADDVITVQIVATLFNTGGEAARTLTFSGELSNV